MWAATGEVWKGCATEEDKSPYLILTHPKGYPELVKPTLGDLRLDKFQNDLKRGTAKGFISTMDMQEWTSFLRQLQDEEGKILQQARQQ